MTEAQGLAPTYYVRHPDDSYSVADPQPSATPSTPTSTMKPDKGEAWREWRQSPGFPAGAETIALQHFDAGFMACWRHPFIRSLVEAQPCAVAGEADWRQAGNIHPDGTVDVFKPWSGYAKRKGARIALYVNAAAAEAAAPSAVLPGEAPK